MTHGDPTVINHWWQILDAIARMLQEVAEQHVTITGYAMELSGTSASAETPLPGGDRLDILGPFSSDATYGDQATPRQVVIEWDQTIRQHYTGSESPPPARSFAVAQRFLRDETERILQSPFADAWCSDLEAVHGRLRALCPPTVDARHDDRAPTARTDLAAMGHLIPAGKMMTRNELDQFFPEALARKDWDRVRKRAQRAREDGEPIPVGRYPVEWIKEIAAAS